MENIELPDEEVPPEIDLDVEANKPEVETEPIVDETVIPNKEDDSKQDEAEEYSKKVNKRINKLVAERNIERDENTKLRDRLDKLEKSQHEATQERVNSDIDSKVADIKRRKMAHMDDGEYEKAEELNDELLDLKIKKHQPAEVQPEQRYQQSEQYQQPQAEVEWTKNNDWFNSNSNPSRSNYAKALFSDLLQEGYDPNDAELYSELDERLGNKPPPQREKPPLQAVPDRGTVTGSSKQVKFTQRDTQLMRDYGLDPNNTDHRSAWLENKKA